MDVIDESLQQQPNESAFDWKLRIIVGKTEGLYDISWDEVCSILKVDVHPDNFRRQASGIYEYYLNQREDLKFECEDIAVNLELKEQNIKKERMRLSTEKIELSKMLRETARVELYMEKMADAIRELKPLETPELRIKQQSTSDSALIVTLADMHYGVEIKINGLMNETLNMYNIEIFEQRMWKLMEEILFVCKKEGFKHIHLFNLSDSIDGILRVSQLVSLRLGMVESVIGLSSFLGSWLNELSKFVYVDYYSAKGNHNEVRPLGSSSGDFPHENTERLITFFLAERLSKNQNVKIHDNHTFNYLQIAGVDILATHGQNEKNLEQSLIKYRTLYNTNIDILLAGHLHRTHVKTIAVGNSGNVQFIQAPSICGTDGYALNKCKSNSLAGSLAFIVEKNVGKTITYEINL